MPDPTSLRSILDHTGMNYFKVSGDTSAVLFKGRSQEKVSVQMKQFGDWFAFFSVDLPEPGSKDEESVFYNLLRLTYSAYYVKAMILESGQLILAAELPLESLTPEVAEGVITGLALLGDVGGDDLTDWNGWLNRAKSCIYNLAAKINIDVQQAQKMVLKLAKEANWEHEQIEGDSLFIKWPLQVPGGPGMKVGLGVKAYKAAISCSVLLAGAQPKSDNLGFVRRLLELNQIEHIAKIGFDDDGDPNVVYEVPKVTPNLLKDLNSHLAPLLLRLLQFAMSRSG